MGDDGLKAPPTPDQFWAWAAELYSRPGVKDALLDAQDCYALDINLALLLLWLDQAGIGFVNSSARQTVYGLSYAWQTNHLAPHRTQRRMAKGTDGYDLLLRHELDMEKAEQKALLAALSERISQSRGSELELYLQHLRPSDPHVLISALKRALSPSSV